MYNKKTIILFIFYKKNCKFVHSVGFLCNKKSCSFRLFAGFEIIILNVIGTYDVYSN